MGFGENLISLREINEISRKDLAKKLDIPYTTLRNYETNQREPGHKLLIQLAQMFSVSVDYLIGCNTSSKKETPSDLPEEAFKIAKRYDSLDTIGKGAVKAILDYEEKRVRDKKVTADVINIERKTVNVPHMSLKASAGVGFDFLDSSDMQERWEVELNELTRKSDFCVDVKGKSMEPMFFDGDVVLIRSQPSVNIGEIGLFVINDKGYIKKQGDDRLISLNPDYDDIFVNEFDEVVCTGKVLGTLNPAWIIEK